MILPEADESTILTVWIPITEATEENGCLKVVPESNKHDLQTHCPVLQGRRKHSGFAYCEGDQSPCP